MQGMVRAANRQADLAIVTAWHTAMFALNGWDGKLKGKKLSDYLSSAAVPQDDEKLRNAKLIAGFHAMKARGIPVEITRH